MAYTPSTRAVNFKNRAVVDVSTDISRKAKQLDSQRAQDVNNFQRQAAGQLTELQRQDQVLSANDQFQIKQLGQFSNYLNDLMKTSAEQLGKSYIDAKREEGIDLARRVASGDEEAIAKVALQEDQLDEIERKIEEQKRKAIEASKTFLEDEARLNLTQKYQALNIRKLGSNVAYGYMKGHFNEAALGYKPHLEAELKSSEEMIPLPEELGGGEIMIKSYNTLTDPKIKGYIESYIENQYIANNNPFGAADSVVYRYLTKSVTKTTDDYREEEYARDKRIIGDEEILDRRTRLFSTATGFNFDETLDYDLVKDGKKVNVLDGPVKDAGEVIQEMLNLGPLSHEMRGSAGSNLANREQVLKDLEQWITNADADTRNEIKQYLEYKKFNLPGQGEKLLKDHFKGDFLIDNIIAAAEEKDAQKAAQFQTIGTRRFKDGINNLKNNYRHGIDHDNNPSTPNVDYSLEDYKNGLDDFLAANPDLTSLDNYDTLVTDAKNWEPIELSEKASLKYYNQTILISGEITRAEYSRLHPTIKSLARKEGKLVEGSWGFDEEGYKEALSNANDRISKHLKDIAGANKTNADFVTNSVDDAIAYAELELVTTAKALFATEKYTTKGQALEEAAKLMVQNMERDKNNRNSTYYFDTSKGFQNINPDKIVDAQLLLNDSIIARDRLVNEITYNNGDAITEKSLISLQGLEPVTNKKTGKIIGFPASVTQVQKLDTFARPKYEIVNAQILAAGGTKDDLIKIEDLDEASQTIARELENRFPYLRAALNSDSTMEIESAIDEMGAISTAYIANSLYNVPINEGDLTKILNEKGINMEDYNSNVELKEKIRGEYINDLIVTAVGTTDNKNEAILKVAYSFKNGKENMGQYKSMMTNNSLTDKIMDDKDFSFGILNSYYSGDTSNLSDGFPSMNIAAVEQKGTSLEKYIKESGTGNLEDLNTQLKTINNLEPEKYVKVNFSGEIIQTQNPVHVKWQKHKTLIENKIAGQTILSDDHKSWDGTNWKPSFDDLATIKLMVRSQHFNDGKVADSLDDPYNALIAKFQKQDNYAFSKTIDELGFLSVLNPFDDRAVVAEKEMKQRFYNFLRKELKNNE
jgi:hypothetical protein